MSFLSSIVIGMLEKELAAQTPEIEQMVLNLVGKLARDVIQYIEKKAGINPLQSPPLAE